jgi:hypothetical protein
LRHSIGRYEALLRFDLFFVESIFLRSKKFDPFKPHRLNELISLHVCRPAAGLPDFYYHIRPKRAKYTN